MPDAAVECVIAQLHYQYGEEHKGRDKVESPRIAVRMYRRVAILGGLGCDGTARTDDEDLPLFGQTDWGRAHYCWLVLSQYRDLGAEMVVVCCAKCSDTVLMVIVENQSRGKSLTSIRLAPTYACQRRSNLLRGRLHSSCRAISDNYRCIKP